MQAIKWCALWTAMVFVPTSLSAANVVGFTTRVNDAYVAVRQEIPANTTIYGIRAYSNDSTLFPEFLLASDSGTKPLPRAMLVLRSGKNIEGQVGPVTATFEPYTSRKDEFVWAIVRFPNARTITTAGDGGGPGVGWVAVQDASRRSFYSVEGAVCEFTASLDILLVTEVVGKGDVSMPENTDPQLNRRAVSLGPLVPNPASTSSEIQFALETPTRVHVGVFDVSGRRVRSLVNQSFSVGSHSWLWDGRDDQGILVASGVYLVKLHTNTADLRRKVILLR